MHLGHYFNYSIVDSYCRWLRYKGEEVFQPFGYDAFGLPAENYARKVGKDPELVTWSNILKFRVQMMDMETEYEERLVTCHPSYIKWTQWLFLELVEHNLAYKALKAVNYCESCETVLANEQVQDGKCERCANAVISREVLSWYFKITDYKDRLIAGLDTVDYPESTKIQQRYWLNNLNDWCVSRQRRWGCPIPIQGETDTLDTFVDSSFYYLRYLTDSDDEFLPKGHYRPIDLYVGGPEHACSHLIYARFIHYFLFDLGIVPQEEPFNRVVHQGLILNNGQKMGKRFGNGIDPGDFDRRELRLALMFIGHFTDGGSWDGSQINGTKKFLNRVDAWLAPTGITSLHIELKELEDKLDHNVLRFKFNKVVSEFMTFYNKHKGKTLNYESKTKFLELLRIFAP